MRKFSLTNFVFTRFYILQVDNKRGHFFRERDFTKSTHGRIKMVKTALKIKFILREVIDFLIFENYIYAIIIFLID